MDYEKKYNEALKRAKAAIDIAADKDLAKGVATTIFPELLESEGERIRKAIISLVHENSSAYKSFAGIDICDMLAYLEKQKEQKPIPDWMPKFLDDLRSKKNYFDWDEHRDLEGHILAIINWIAPNYFNRKEQEQKPAEKQDYSGLNDLERAIHRGFLCAGVENVSVTIIEETARDCLAQMKPVEGNEYLSPECGTTVGVWSKEDKDNVAKYLHDMEGGMLWIKATKVTSDILDMLRPSWKPSEEQMSMLRAVINDPNNSGAESCQLALRGIYEQLKKL